MTLKKKVRILDRLEHDLCALEKVTEQEEPPKRPACPSKVARPKYLFGYTLGYIFGMSEWQPGLTDVMVDYGLWKEDFSSKTSSNQQEFLNIICKIEELDNDVAIKEGTKFWIFTGNFFFESCFYKGGGGIKSQSVLDLVLRLYLIEMKGKAFIHVVWISDRQMIAQGTDGLSRGKFTSGAMRGMPMLEFVPLHLSVLDRRKDPVLRFINNITGGKQFSSLNCPSGSSILMLKTAISCGLHHQSLRTWRFFSLLKPCIYVLGMPASR
jgi:hypothetical protein